MMPSTAPRNASANESGIDRLFMRFAALYGKHWLDMWAGIPMAEVKATWAENLAKLDRKQLEAGLEHCSRTNKFPPTCPEFVAMCRQMRKEEVRLLRAPRTEMPPEIRDKLHAFVKRVNKTI